MSNHIQKFSLSLSLLWTENHSLKLGQAGFWTIFAKHVPIPPEAGWHIHANLVEYFQKALTILYSSYASPHANKQHLQQVGVHRKFTAIICWKITVLRKNCLACLTPCEQNLCQRHTTQLECIPHKRSQCLIFSECHTAEQLPPLTVTESQPCTGAHTAISNFQQIKENNSGSNFREATVT